LSAYVHVDEVVSGSCINRVKSGFCVSTCTYMYIYTLGT